VRTLSFSTNCTRCERLAGFLAEVRKDHPDYFGKPVPSFGPAGAPVLIVGLAPGMHGANATGRPFTGDHAGILLYQTLYDFGFANQAEAVAADDGLELIECRITNAVRCLPPQNKPQLDEVKHCNHYLRAELDELQGPAVVLALGKIAHDAVLRALALRLSAYPFGHEHVHQVSDDFSLLDSYHCSRYNTQTRRLTPAMFGNVFKRARRILDGKESPAAVC